MKRDHWVKGLVFTGYTSPKGIPKTGNLDYGHGGVRYFEQRPQTPMTAGTTLWHPRVANGLNDLRTRHHSRALKGW